MYACRRESLMTMLLMMRCTFCTCLCCDAQECAHWPIAVRRTVKVYIILCTIWSRYNTILFFVFDRKLIEWRDRWRRDEEKTRQYLLMRPHHRLDASRLRWPLFEHKQLESNFILAKRSVENVWRKKEKKYAERPHIKWRCLLLTCAAHFDLTSTSGDCYFHYFQIRLTKGKARGEWKKCTLKYYAISIPTKVILHVITVPEYIVDYRRDFVIYLHFCSEHQNQQNKRSRDHRFGFYWKY